MVWQKEIKNFENTQEVDIHSPNAGNSTALPWGFWPTIGFSFLTILIFSAIQTAVTICFAIANGLQLANLDAHLLETNGLLLSIATCISAPFSIAAVILFAKIGKRPSLKEYFCFYNPEKKVYIIWILSLLALAFCSDCLTTLLGRPIVPDFVLKAYTTVGFKPLIWLAIIFVAPINEEIIFRGFVFKGIQHSRLGTPGAIFLSSLGWAALHLQYDLYGMATVFAGGLLLGTARFKSNSIYVTIVMHATWSLIAMVEVAIIIAR